MRYCRRCLLPSSKLYIAFDADGICNACRAHETKTAGGEGIDWPARARQFEELIQWTLARRAPYYDAVVPVSGGKDSITQVHYLRDRGLRILAVNVDFGIKTEIGHRNLARIPEMGASLVTYRPELELHRRLIRLGFEDYGSPELLCHPLLHAYPLHVALRFGVPLVLLGENSAFEYGGEAALAGADRISRKWFQKYAAMAGQDAGVISARYEIPMERLKLYDFPDEIEASGTRAVFTSHFFHWDSEAHFEIARRYGFKALDVPFEGSYRTYVGIDEEITRLHHYMKFLKFGYGRATDHACEDIRSGRLTRQAAKALVRRHDPEPVSEAFIDRFIAFAGLSRRHFDEVLDRWRNPDIWRHDTARGWYIPGYLEEERDQGHV